LKEKNKRARKLFASKGIMEFGKTYFPEYFTLRVPEVHSAIYSDLESMMGETLNTGIGHHYAVALPRGCAKSTILDFLFPLYCICFSLKKYILIISASQDLANTFLGTIKDEIEFNLKLLSDFGCLRGDVWNAENFTTNTNIKVHALGSGSKVRGLKNKESRPDLIIMDDLENDEGIRSPEQRRKLNDWFFKAVAKLGDKSTDFIFLGTVLHYDALLVKVLRNAAYSSKKFSAIIKWSENAELWGEWEQILVNMQDDDRLIHARAYFDERQEDMLAGTEVLWEDKYSYYDLMVMKVTEGDASFNTEMMNNPINPEDAVFNRSWFKYFKLDDLKKDFKHLELYGAVDASMGKRNNADYSAIVIFARNKRTGQMYVLEANLKRRHPDQIIEDIATIVDYWQTLIGKRFMAFGVEDIAFQSFFKDTLRRRLMQKNVYLNIIGVTNTQDKQMRIERLQPDVKNGYIMFQEDQYLLLEQLEFFPLAPHDDGPDALEMARKLVSRSLTAIGKLPK
jgi:predicted phage terminase large subunit-like protein